MSAGRALGWWPTARAVLWGFLGVRSRQEWDADTLRLSPLSLMAVGFVGVLLLVALLMALVFWIVPGA
jgi:hypothetical protein